MSRMQTVRTELKIDRLLLNPEFEGYKLSLDLFPMQSTNLPQKVHQCHASDSQWSLLHVHIFANHGNLVSDFSNTEMPKFFCYLIDGSVCQLTLDKEDNTKLNSEIIFQIEIPEDFFNRGDKYNATMSFPSAEFAFLSNGCGTLWLCDRRSSPYWKMVNKTSDICDGAAFVIIHSVVKCEGKVLECVLKLVEEVNEKDSKTRHVTSLVWVTFKCESDLSWSLQRKRKLHTKGVVEYAALSNEISAVCIISTNSVKFISDSEKPINHNIFETEVLRSNYTWRQTADEIMVEFCLTDETSKPQVNSMITDHQVNMSVVSDKKELVLLSGEFYSPIDASASFWNLNENKLEVHLHKKDVGKMWTEVVTGDSFGEYIPEPDLLQAAAEQLETFTSDTLVTESCANTEQLEECDSSSELCLTWLDGETHAVLIQADFGGHQWLFAVPLNAIEPPYICLRHDVDGILWRISNNPLTNVNTCGSHFATFDAFGYIHAGKQSRKFATCSTDCSYTIICDCNKHAFVYWCQSAIDTCLRNRKTGKVVSHISKQQLISLNGDEDILGVVALPKCLLLLTENHCYLANVGNV